MFKGCLFKTNIYGTFRTHKCRKHNQYTLQDFKQGIVSIVENQSSVDGDIENSLRENEDCDDANEIDAEISSLSDSIELKFASVLLKLKNYFHVPCVAIDELLSELHHLISCASVPSSNKNIILSS